MDLSFRLKVAPERRLVMTFALKQALEILQMSRIELTQFLNEEMEKNPLLRELPSKKSSLGCDELAAPISLYDHLMSQIRESFTSPSKRKLAEALIEHLDEKGFLSTPMEEIASLTGSSLLELESILQTLQTLDPPGIFARNLQEALLLQLQAKGETNGPTFRLVRDCFEDLIHGRYSAIKKKIETIDLSLAIQKLARLRFRPTETFRREPTALAIADLRIEKRGNRWIIETKDEELPQFEIAAEYESAQTQSKEEQQSIKNWSTAARWLIRSLKRRRQILLQIGALLVQKQSNFLSQKGDLCPLSIQELARELSLHESTLSRALSGKYAETPRGLIPLRSLITNTPATKQAKEVLAELIETENKKTPLTDEELANAISLKGYPIARRTVVKYRKDLKIPSATHRRDRSL